MNLLKAIEILSGSANAGVTTFNQDFKDAERLGIEALKWRAKWERASLPDKWPLLPGETED